MMDSAAQIADVISRVIGIKNGVVGLKSAGIAMSIEAVNKTGLATVAETWIAKEVATVTEVE